LARKNNVFRRRLKAAAPDQAQTGRGEQATCDSDKVFGSLFRLPDYSACPSERFTASCQRLIAQ
jgi:hypothetical protein